MLKVLFFILKLFELINGNNFLKLNKNISNNSNLTTFRYLLHNTIDTISFVYPKELGHIKDYKQSLYKIIYDAGDRYKFNIEDSVHDNQTNSIYFYVSNVYKGGTDLIRLTDTRSLNESTKSKMLSNQPPNFKFKYFYASNWSITIIYKNSNVRLSSLDIDVKRQKLYWLENKWKTSKWSFVIKNLNDLNEPPKYYEFKTKDFSMEMFATISVAHDYENDLVVFISNSKTLGICYSISMMCIDYFKSSSYSKPLSNQQQENQAHYKLDQEKTKQFDFNLNLIEKEIENTPLLRFKSMKGIVYDKIEHILYFSDQANDRIAKIHFDRNDKIRNEYAFVKIEDILKSDYENARIRPYTQLVYNNDLYWIDFDGIKISLKNGTCSRTIYRIRDSCSLKFVQTSLLINYE